MVQELEKTTREGNKTPGERGTTSDETTEENARRKTLEEQKRREKEEAETGKQHEITIPYLTNTTSSRRADAFMWCLQMERKQTSPTTGAWITT